MPLADAHLSPLRELYTTASQAAVICHGNAEALLRLWRERIGELPPEDLSDVLAVQLGKLCGPFIIDWVERTGGHEITERERFIPHPTLPLAATLDGFREFDCAVIESKLCNPFAHQHELIAYHSPQVLVQMRCRNAARGILAVLRGFNLQEFEVHTDADYERAVFERLLAFQTCVDRMVPPVHIPQRKLVPPELWRTIDLARTTPLPNWAPPMIQNLRQWSDTRDASRMHDEAKQAVKDLMPDDVGAVLFDAINVKRAKNGALLIREKEPS